jgi:hypothetical protein
VPTSKYREPGRSTDRGSSAQRSRGTRLRPAEPGQVATVKGASLSDVQAFVAAAAVQADATGTSQVLARMAFVDDPAAWRRLTTQESPLLLLPVTDEVKAEVVSLTPHLILVPVPGASTADIELPPIDAAAAAAALLEEGMEDERRAESAGRLARRSLIALRRNLARKPDSDASAQLGTRPGAPSHKGGPFGGELV